MQLMLAWKTSGFRSFFVSRTCAQQRPFQAVVTESCDGLERPSYRQNQVTQDASDMRTAYRGNARGFVDSAFLPNPIRAKQLFDAIESVVGLSTDPDV